MSWGIGIIEIWFVTFHSTKATKKNRSFYNLWYDPPFFEIRVVQQSVWKCFQDQYIVLANNYYSNYRSSLNTLKKHKILEKLRRNKDIVIIRPDMGNGVVVMDRVIHNQQMDALLSERPSFKNRLEIQQSYTKDNCRDTWENLKRNSF